MTPADVATLGGARVLVTGASRGYGAAIARALAAHGAHLLLTATTVDRLSAVADQCRTAGASAVECLALDLGSATSVQTLVDDVRERVPRVEGVVLNAAILGARGPIAEMTPRDVHEAITANVTSQLQIISGLDEHVGSGASIVVVTSGAAGKPGRGVYGLTKGMLDVAADMLRHEMAHRSVRVVRINPGPMRTEMRARVHPDENPATVPPPAERVAPVLAVLAGDDPGACVQASEWGRS